MAQRAPVAATPAARDAVEGGAGTRKPGREGFKISLKVRPSRVAKLNASSIRVPSRPSTRIASPASDAGSHRTSQAVVTPPAEGE